MCKCKLSQAEYDQLDRWLTDYPLLVGLLILFILLCLRILFFGDDTIAQIFDAVAIIFATCLTSLIAVDIAFARGHRSACMLLLAAGLTAVAISGLCWGWPRVTGWNLGGLELMLLVVFAHAVKKKFIRPDPE